MFRREHHHHHAYPPAGVSWQRRSLYAFAAYLIATGMFDTAAGGMFAPHSLRYMAAGITGFREWLSLGYLLCVFGVLPFIVAQRSPHHPPRWTVLMLCISCVSAALLWIGEAFADRHVNLEGLRPQYLRYALEAVFFSLTVAANYNANKRMASGVCDAVERGSNRVPLK